VTIATNIISNVDYTANITSSAESNKLNNIAYDLNVVKLENLKSGIKSFNGVEIYTKEDFSSFYSFFDVQNPTGKWTSLERNAKLEIGSNYGYAYLTRFEDNIWRNNIKFVNNYSLFKHNVENNHETILLNNLNRATRSEMDNVYISANFTSYLNGNGYGIYGIKLFDKTSKGIFAVNIGSASEDKIKYQSKDGDIQTSERYENGELITVIEKGNYSAVISNITFDFDSFGNSAINQEFFGPLASVATYALLDNVNIEYSGTENNQVQGIAVGGVVGNSNNSRFNEVSTSNYLIRALNSGENGISSPGIAGGFVAYSENTIFENSTNSIPDFSTCSLYFWLNFSPSSARIVLIPALCPAQTSVNT
jgi:hypothetical protein